MRFHLNVILYISLGEIYISYYHIFTTKYVLFAYAIQTRITFTYRGTVSPNDSLIKLYSEHSAPIVLSSLGSVPQAFVWIVVLCHRQQYFVMSRRIFDLC